MFFYRMLIYLKWVLKFFLFIYLIVLCLNIILILFLVFGIVKSILIVEEEYILCVFFMCMYIFIILIV